MLKKVTNKFVICTVPADALAPLGTRASAGTVMTKVQLWPRYSYDQGTVMTKVQLWPRYSYDQGTVMTKVQLWPRYSYDQGPVSI